MSEKVAEKPLDFESVVNIFSELIKPEQELEIDGDTERDVLFFSGKFRNLELEPSVSEIAKLGDRVICEVIGDDTMGIAILFRSPNPFLKDRYGFFIQPEDAGKTISVWHAPARKPEKYEWIGASLLDRDQAQQATPKIAESLVHSLQSRADK